ncbi:MAG: helix-turn-helix domain-containing protein [Actinomycetia bacterium]|nr:helix-turn-helix domain-containing protein [Actinomycetes bacterium]
MAATTPTRRVELSAGAAQLELAAGHGWGELNAELAAVLAAGARPVADSELAALANTIALLTRGLVTIEDTQARMIAYSASTDEVDELRRLSILGRSGPPAYLALLRQWGVYDRLAIPDEVVEIVEHPESGIRPRLAVGVFAGREQLGTIWVQQGGEEFPPHARQALLGAARVAAGEFATARRRGGTSRDDELAALLSGRAATLPGMAERAARRPCAIAVFAVDAEETDRAARLLDLDVLAGIARVHAAALRTGALVSETDDLVRVLLPDLPDAKAAAPTLRAATAAANRHLGDPRGRRIRAAIGPVVGGVGAAAVSARGAEQALRAAPDATVVVFDELRPQLFVAAALAAVAARGDLWVPEVAALSSDAADTLARYLDHGGDIVAAAAALGVHPTTVRYRLRKIGARIDLADPDTRLAAHLQLRAAAVAPGLPPAANQ